MSVLERPLQSLDKWYFEDEPSALRHDSGGFFSIVGIDIRTSEGPVPHWSQPIIDQPEVGILGFLGARFDGVFKVLVQAKNEPGNPHGSQLSPTVQATRSNYMRVHGGRAVPYLDYFRDRSDESALADVRQSEHGSWFLAKRNRNMVVMVSDPEEVVVDDGFAWFTLGDIYQALGHSCLVNMDARTVLACLPFAGAGNQDSASQTAGTYGALARSFSGRHGSVHALPDILAAITHARATVTLLRRQVSLASLSEWRLVDGRIKHQSGAFFDVLGTQVECSGREVSAWAQPMIQGPNGAIACFLAADIDDVLHVLVRLRSEAGFIDVVELGPTVQCAPVNYEHLPRPGRPPFLDDVLAAIAKPEEDTVLFDCVLAEEGGRFRDTKIRYLIVRTDAAEEPPGYRWMTLSQLVDLARHSHYVSVQARTLVLAAQAVLAEAAS